MSETDRNRRQTDVFDPDRARAMQATLGQSPSIEAGEPLPPFFHQIYFWDSQPRGTLGRDGHPSTGGFLPNLGLPRRMWAAGRVIFHKPLVAGIRAERLSRIDAVTRKSGKSGPLAFVTLRHDIKQRAALAVTEFQDIVYREDRPEVATDTPQAPTDESVAQDMTFDSTMLFRYSALTFNGHRIHYDFDYATGVEGYDGLVVHGPLLAQLLILFAQSQIGPLQEFQYRATSPLMVHETATLCWTNGRTWVRGPGGRQIMIATAR